jgi:GNAT superfamily N-acetyltransferase
MSHVEFKIRRAVEIDREAAHRLIAELGYSEINPVDFKKVFAEALNHKETFVFLAEEDLGKVIGLMSISYRPQLRLAGTLVCIDELVIAEEARGMGVGKALLNVAKDIAAQLGAKRLELHTNRGRVSYQRAFYVKNGFSESNSAVMRLEPEFSENE